MDNLEKVQSRKWQITINNPEEHGFTTERIVDTLASIRGKSLYWCFCYEEGDECETRHVHIYLYRSSPFTARAINNLFPDCHREPCFGTNQDNRAYILKDGPKFNKDENGHYHYVDAKGKSHDGINFSDTFQESGDCPEEHQGVSTTADIIVGMIKEGADDESIIDAVPSSFKELEKIQRVRSMYRDKQFADTWRDLTVVYLFGSTGAGKTRFVMDGHGYRNVFRVTDYKHPFDTYNGQDVILFDEFRGSLKLSDMLIYLDGYPVELPCRYFNRQACYTKVYIISNIPPDMQYKGVDIESVQAFYRRIHMVVEAVGKDNFVQYASVDDYIHRNDWTNGPVDYDFQNNMY